MDFVEVLEVVSAVIRQFKTDAWGSLISIWLIEEIKEVEAITEDLLGRRKYILKELEDKKGHLDDPKKSLESLLAVVYEMEDSAETYLLRRMGTFNRRYNFILQKLYFKTDADFPSAIMIERKILQPLLKGIFKRIKQITDSLKNIQESQLSHEESDVIGFEEPKDELATWLTDTSLPDLGLILISGRTGSGKTTLARDIYKSSKIESHFGFRLWVSASEDPNANVFRSIWEQITNDSIVYNDTENKLVATIRENLLTKRCLVVFDHVRPESVDIYSRMNLSKEGSRLIMTTRENVLNSYGDSRVLTCKLKPLSNENAWKLFKKVSLTDNVQFDNPDMLQSKIKNICGGIPSAILVLGRFLSTKKNDIERLAVLKQPIEGNEVSVSNILALMNSDLTIGLRLCLLYFGLFPKGDKIPVRRLMRLWIAEGFVTDLQDPERTAEGYLIKFQGLKMIEIVKCRKDGSPKTCRMPGIVHDICLSKAEDIFGLLHIHRTTTDHESSDASSPSPKLGVRRVAEHGDIKNVYSRGRIDSLMQHLRSYLSFNPQNKDTPAVEIGKFLSEVIGRRGFGLLKVLDLEGVYKPKLPHNLGKLYQLRYLGLRWTFLDTLPHSVSELRYLETLDVKHTNISSPPNSIWKMQYLRHLCLNEIRLDVPVKKHTISLTGLHTLWGLFIDNNSPVKNGLDSSKNLRKLGLTFRLDNVEALNYWIASLKELKSLRLRSKTEFGRPSELKLNPDILSGLENLESLYLLGKLPELHNGYFPQKLEVLTLSVSNLEKDPMPILAQLPVLYVLRLLADSYTGKKMVCPNGGFLVLKSLKLWMLKELETWTVEEGAMQQLEELEIRCCHKLKELPDKLDLIYIEKIILTNMQEEFVVKVQAKIPENSGILEVPDPPLPVRCNCQESG